MLGLWIASAVEAVEGSWAGGLESLVVVVDLSCTGAILVYNGCGRAGGTVLVMCLP